MQKSIPLLILTLFFFVNLQAQRESKELLIEKLDALMGMHNVCVSPRFENSFICRYILDQNSNRQTGKAFGRLASHQADSLQLEGFNFAEQQLRKELMRSNKKKNCTSLSCRTYRHKKSVSYSCPLLSKDETQALIFVHYYQGKQCRSGELYQFIKIEGRWKIIQKIKYFAS